MKTQTLGLFAILSLGVGLASFSSASIFQESTDFGTYGDSIAISGHVTVIHSDAQGNILGYQQYDNVITNEGLECLTESMFATTNSTVCGAASPADQFDVIGLLGTTPTPFATDTVLGAQNVPVTGGGLGVAATDDVGVDIVADGVGDAVTGKVTAGIAKTFTKLNSTAAVIGGAVLQNAAGDAIFAAKAFGGDITLNENDTLLVTWSIQIGT